MISATDFAQRHGSFWRTHFPAMENYVRLVNTGGYQRFFPEMKWTIESSRNFLISEIAFCISKNRSNSKLNVMNMFTEAKERLSGLPTALEDINPPDKTESQTAIQLAQRLNAICNEIAQDNDFVFDPVFPGCGALGKSRGDILTGDALIEVKSVDRPFRASDFRQVIAYCFQNIANGKSNIQRIGIVNPRRGIYYVTTLDQAVYNMSGVSIQASLGSFFSAVGMGGVSR